MSHDERQFYGVENHYVVVGSAARSADHILTYCVCSAGTMDKSKILYARSHASFDPVLSVSWKVLGT